MYENDIPCSFTLELYTCFVVQHNCEWLIQAQSMQHTRHGCRAGCISMKSYGAAGECTIRPAK